MFDAPSGDCYGAVACMCNKQCIHECEQDKLTPFEKCSSQKCMCDLSLEKAKAIQEEYFKEPLKLVNSTADQNKFQADLMKAQKEGPKKQKYLKKLTKIQNEWNAYKKNAAALGVDTASLCNLTCSDSCFTDAKTSNDQVVSILTSCLLSKCACFKPSLPDAKDDELTTFTNIVVKAETEVEKEMPDYATYSIPATTTLLAVEGVAPKVSASFDSMVDKVSGTAKDIYKGVHEKADQIIEKTNSKAKVVAADADQKVADAVSGATDKAQGVVDTATAKATEISTVVNAKADEILSKTSQKITVEEKADEIITAVKDKSSEILSKIKVNVEVPEPSPATPVETTVGDLTK